MKIDNTLVEFTSMPPKIDYSEESLFLARITPEVASFFLARNYKDQRAISRMSVTQYSDDMRTGRWKAMVNDPITFDINGRLTNGQHRVKAVIESGVTIDDWILTGQPEENFQFYDGGRTRSAASYVQIPDANAIVSTARCMLLIDRGVSIRSSLGRGGQYRPSRQSLLEYVKEYEAQVASIKNTTKSVRKSLGKLPDSLIATWIYTSAITSSEESIRETIEAIKNPSRKEHYEFREFFKDMLNSRNSKPTKEKLFGSLARFHEGVRLGNYPQTYTRVIAAFDRSEKALAETIKDMETVNPRMIWRA